LKQSSAISAWRPHASAGYHVEELDGDLLLLHPSNQIILHTNQTAALVWRLCDGERSVAEIVALLGDAYPEASADIAADVPALLLELAEQGAIRWG